MDTKDHIGVEVKRLDNEIHSRMAVYRVEKGQGELTMMQSWILGYLYEHPEDDYFCIQPDYGLCDSGRLKKSQSGIIYSYGEPSGKIF